MAKTDTETEGTARSEARIPALGHRPIPKADGLLMRLSQADQIRFAEALINPPEPGRRLKDAARLHRALVERR